MYHQQKMEKRKNMEVLKKKMTGRSYRKLLIQQAQKRLKCSENVVGKKDEVAQGNDHHDM
ncbi:hypothetical protein P3L10_026995 [Capsicum annuum]